MAGEGRASGYVEALLFAILRGDPADSIFTEVFLMPRRLVFAALIPLVLSACGQSGYSHNYRDTQQARATLGQGETPAPSKAASSRKRRPAANSPTRNSENQPKVNNPQPAPGPANLVPLIPRREFFGNPDKARARISPDGSKLAFLAPVDGVLNVWVGPVADLDAAKAVTKDTKRGIMNFFWAYTSKHILYTQDKDGDEDWHVYAVDLETDEIKDLTPLEKISAQIDGVSEKFPEEILVGINDRDNHELHDIYKVNILSGERELVQQNPGFAGFMTDDDYRVRLAFTFTPDAGQLYLLPDEKAEEGWKEYLSIGAEDAMTTGAAGFDKTGDILYFLDSRDRNTAALTTIDLNTGEQKVLAKNDQADISDVITHPTEKHVQAVKFTYLRTEWQVLDEAIAPDLEYLKTVEDGELQLTSRTLDDRTWTVAYTRDDGPVDFYLYDREAKKAEFLFTSNPSLDELPLVKMHAVEIEARDGLKLVSYLSLPKPSDPDGDGVPKEPLPMVLNVHGGPWARDTWGYDPEHQLWANRGYAVLSVNYRGSTGFGKEFLNAANREWAAAMHDDLIDAVNWAVEQGIAQKDKVAIVGGSYGGYAALVGLTFTPEVFACGIDQVGPSSLVTLMQNPPPYWAPFMPVMKLRVGDWTTEEGREFLESRSPLFHVEKIKRPLLIVQGAQDPRVKQAEADQIVEAMQEKSIPVTYLLYPEEGHGLARPENRFAFYAVAEAFLTENLGGRREDYGDAFDGAKFEVPAGAEEAPGLAEALEERENEQ
jgi:dipeptidyl aminopeptidase/acylaminoacyl peptidase